ncbi:hypothetical protein EV702DRAFT_960786 [Suillus placidus]|uniref:Uncharacterized protein n=1 Tax=Suillus placidus TaxID=48579 RepID=A0A9P7A4J2_9AGAM|nr:hypothetical protein EV702DRAFT_960786 [Suillus placidus]
MSQPASTVSKCVMTRAKNATQHPGYILTRGEGHIKRRTKAQKAADDQHEEEEKRASEMAELEGHNRIAAFQKKMETDQAATRVDAPKPTRPRPCPVKKAVKATETSNLTMAEDKAVSTNGKGGRAGGKLATSANVEHPESDAEEEVRVPGSRKKKEMRKVLPVKTPVRDAIKAAGLIDESTMACDDDKKPDDVSIPDYGIAAGRISGCMSDISPAGSKPSSGLRKKIPMMPSNFSSTVPSSKLTMGSTISSGGAPLTPINTIADAGADNVADRFTTLFADNDLAESVERSQALARMSKPRATQGVKISSKVPDTPVQTIHAYRNTNLTPQQLNAIQSDVVADDEMNVEAAPPVVASLVNYGSDTDMESDLEPPPSTQVPRGYYDADIRRAAALTRTQTSHSTEDAPSSDVEFVNHIKPVVVKTESEPVSLRVTSATNVGVKHRAPVAKRTKSSIAHTRSLSSISILTHFMSSQDNVETDEDRKIFAKNLCLKLVLPLRRHVYSFSRHTTTNSFLMFQMEHALDIFSGDTRVSELKVNSKGKAIKVPHSMNKASGKPSSALKAFSDTNYGDVTRGYMTSINRLRESVIRDVWERTKEIATKRRGAPAILDGEDSDDERALIYDDW